MKYLTILLAIMLTGCAAVSHHLWGYEKSVYVDDAEPLGYYLYWDVQGVDMTPFKKLTPVQERALKIAAIEYPDATQGYNDDGWAYIELDGKRHIISTSPSGMWLEIGFDPEWH